MPDNSHAPHGMKADRDAFGRTNPLRIDDVLHRPLTLAELHALATAFTLSHLLGVVEQIVQIPSISACQLGGRLSEA